MVEIRMSGYELWLAPVTVSKGGTGTILALLVTL
jgi:hypothetical protein